MLIKNNTSSAPTVGTTSPSYVEDDYIYVDEYTMVRPNYTVGYYSSPIFECYFEDIPAGLDYATLDALCRQVTIPGTSTTHSPWGKSKLIIGKHYTNQPGLSDNEDYLTGTKYTSGNEIEGVCIYYIGRSRGASPLYLGEFIDKLEADNEIQKAYDITVEGTGRKVFHTNIYMTAGKSSSSSKINVRDTMYIGKDNGQYATLNNIQTLTVNGTQTLWKRANAQSSVPFNPNICSTISAGPPTSSTYPLSYLERIKAYPVWANPFQIRLGAYSGTTFYGYGLILATPAGAQITDINVLGGN